MRDAGESGATDTFKEQECFGGKTGDGAAIYHSLRGRLASALAWNNEQRSRRKLRTSDLLWAESAREEQFVYAQPSPHLGHRNPRKPDARGGSGGVRGKAGCAICKSVRELATGWDATGRLGVGKPSARGGNDLRSLGHADCGRYRRDREQLRGRQQHRPTDAREAHRYWRDVPGPGRRGRGRAAGAGWNTIGDDPE